MSASFQIGDRVLVHGYMCQIAGAPEYGPLSKQRMLPVQPLDPNSGLAIGMRRCVYESEISLQPWQREAGQHHWTQLA